MQRVTPPLLAKGKYTLNTPYTLNASMEYQCISIRDFIDCYRKGEDVQGLYYTPVGLIDGANGFSFDAEVDAKVSIVTLKGTDGTLVYVPDTYIVNYPVQSEVPYKHLVLSCSLGILPDSVEIEALILEIANIATAMTGKPPVIQVSSLPILNHPTDVEHASFEAIRQGNISISETSQETIIRLNARITEMSQTILLLSQNTPQGINP